MIFYTLQYNFTCGMCCRLSMGPESRNWRDCWRELGLRVWVLFTMSTVQRRIFSRAFFCLTSFCVHSLCRASFGAAFTERSPRGSSSSTALLSEYAPVLRHLHNKLLRDAELHYTWALWFSIIERQLSLMPYANFYESDAQVGSVIIFF